MDIIGVSEHSVAVNEFIKTSSQHKLNVLIYGESGVGKSQVAKNICLADADNTSAIKVIDCSKIDKNYNLILAESETIIFKHIDLLPLAIQDKLIELYAVKNIRIIATAKQTIFSKVEANMFREKLLFIISVTSICIAPLRLRTKDIPIYIEHFLTTLANKLPVCTLSFDAIEELQNYTWSGNINELKTIVHNLCEDYPAQNITKTQIAKKLLQLSNNIANYTEIVMQKSEPELYKFDLKKHLENIEVDYIQLALDKANWVVAAASRLLGIRRTTLIEKMRKYHIVRSVNTSL